MDQNNGLEAKIFEEETGTLPTIVLGEVPLMPTRVSLQDPTLHIGTTIRMTEDHMTNAQISHSIEAMETGPELKLSTIRMGTGGTMEIFLVPHRLQGETSHRIIPIAKQVINLITLLSADLTTDPRLALHLTNKSSHKIVNQMSSNVVRFTTTDDTINELSDLCPLNY